ncbi:MAG: HNH endonuclease [Dehalococcoidia bacterium]
MRDCVIDEAGVARTVRRARTALPADVERHVRRRDRHCRVPGCEATRGLQIHHTQPLCDNPETFDPAKLAVVCPYHHRFLEPHGPYRLIGDAEDPDGLRLVHRDERVRDGPDP